MTRPLLCAALLLLVLAACRRDFQIKYAGDIPIQVLNKASKTVDTHIGPADTMFKSKRWGDPIPPGGSATFKVIAGSYFIGFNATDEYGDVIGAVRRENVPIRGPTTVVVADEEMKVEPNALLIVMQYPDLGGYAESGGGDGDEGGGDDSGGDDSGGDDSGGDDSGSEGGGGDDAGEDETEEASADAEEAAPQEAEPACKGLGEMVQSSIECCSGKTRWGNGADVTTSWHCCSGGDGCT